MALDTANVRKVDTSEILKSLREEMVNRFGDAQSGVDSADFEAMVISARKQAFDWLADEVDAARMVHGRTRYARQVIEQCERQYQKRLHLGFEGIRSGVPGALDSDTFVAPGAVYPNQALVEGDNVVKLDTNPTE
jgi:hypothetical protein